MSDKNVFQRLNEIRKAVQYVQKDTQVQTYKAVTHDAVTAKLRPHLVEHGILIATSQISGKVLQFRGTDVKQNFYKGDYEVAFINIDKPDDRLVVKVQSHAADSADKAPSKAMSVATKYAMLKTFSLETGENEEGRYHEAPLFTDAQKSLFDDLLEGREAVNFACFNQEVGEHAMLALQNTFPSASEAEQGQLAKSAGKKLCKELEAEGWAEMRNYADEIKQLIANQDPAVLELTDAIHGTEKRIIAGMLDGKEIAHLTKLKELAG